MKQYLTIVFLVTSLLIANAQSKLQVSSAEVSFVFVNNDVDGTMGGFKSESIIDTENLSNSKFKGSVEVETISTGNSIRNWSLRRGKYFDADNYPRITFESASVIQEEDAIMVKGKLTIKDVSKNISFSFERNGKQLVGRTSLYSSDYGINIKNDREKNKVLVKLVFQLK